MNLQIGLSGLEVAQQAMALIGTNIANASTEGYHLQTPNIQPRVSRGANGAIYGGAMTESAIRNMDGMLELEMLRALPLSSQIEQELFSLQSIETAMGEVDGENLSVSIEQFFSSLQELASQPDDVALRSQVVLTAESMAGQFQTLSTFLAGLRATIQEQAQTLTAELNDLALHVSELNQEIRALDIKGQQTNILRDQRDQAIKDLSEIAPVRLENINPEANTADVVIWSTSVVTGSRYVALESAILEDAQIGIGIEGAGYFTTGHTGGKLGALMELNNETIPEIQARIDAIAREIATEVNRIHAEGIGTDGSFTDLTGRPTTGGAVDQWDTPVTPGDFHVRLIDASGSATVHTVTVAAGDTLADVAAKIGAIDPAHLSANVSAGTLRMQSSGGYEFDFLPISLADTSGLSGADVPDATVRGPYTGSENQTFALTVQVGGGGSANVGLGSDLTLLVQNGAGETVRTLTVGSGYAAGDELEIADGLTLSLGTGTLHDGEVLAVEAVRRSDETGFLAAAGLNTFFQGNTGATIAVRQELMDSPGLLAAATSPNGADNDGALRMSEVGRAIADSLDGATPGDAFRRVMTLVGEQIATRQARHEAQQDVLEQLEIQRDSVGGVDINDEAARLIVFERMFQSMAKLLNIQQESLAYMMDIL